MSDDPSADVALIEQLERERLRALVEANMAVCERLHADGYELIPPGGNPISRADYLGAIASGEMRYTVFEPVGEVRVRHYETAAIVRYQARIELQFPGGSDAGLLWHTDTYELRDGNWQAVWSQATRIQPPRA